MTDAIISLPAWSQPVVKGKSSSYPGGSKSRVTKAGAAVRSGTATAEDLACIDLWRAAHAPVLNTFQALLRQRARSKQVVVGQRHKRKMTIFGKLERFPGMELARMDDIAGCRLIFDSIEKLHEFRESSHGAKFKHKRRNDDDKYNYLKYPKSTGYRGIHDIYEYDAQSEQGKDYKGLFIELQYRTRVQHAWATAVELVGVITTSQPKFQEGDKRYEEVMSYASEILARAHEKSKSCHPDIDDKELVKEFLARDEELGLLNLLRGLNSSNERVAGLKNAILILKEGKPLEVRTFRYSPDALKALFEIEAENPGTDVVLVKGESADDVRLVFKNYFSDARDFISLLESGCEKLSGKRILQAPPARRGTKSAKASPAKPDS
jgi:ppGpp synthetase/RelA/SpoT-type nucleotidyltranferase